MNIPTRNTLGATQSVIYIFSYIISILSTASILIVLSRWIDQEQFCIHAQGVQKIEWSSADQPEIWIGFESCTVFFRPNPKAFVKNSSDLERFNKMSQVLLWIQDVDQLRKQVGLNGKSLQLRIQFEDPFILQQEGPFWNLGSQWLQDPMLFKSILLGMTLRSFELYRESWQYEVMTDLLLAILRNQFLKINSDGEVRYASDIQFWNQRINPESWCLSRWRSPFDFDGCIEKSRPQASVVSRGLWLALNKLPLIEKIPTLQRLLAYSFNESLSHEDAIQVQRVLCDALEFAAKRPCVLNEAEFYQLGLDGHHPWPILIETESLNPIQFKNVQPMYFKVGSEIQLFYEGELFPVLTPPLDHWIIVNCQPPNWSKLLSLSRESVLFVETCNGEALDGINWLSRGDLEGFLLNNESLRMIWMKSQMLSAWIQNMNPARRQTTVRLSWLRKKSYWLEDVWDWKTKSFRSKAAFEAVISHRVAPSFL